MGVSCGMRKVEEEGGGMEGGEGGGTTPPLSKKASEGAFGAGRGGVRGLRGAIGLFKTAAAPVMKGGVAGLVVPTRLNFA